jgi:hypothetical protein
MISAASVGVQDPLEERMTVLEEHITLAPTVTRDLQKRASARRFPGVPW